MPIPFFGKNPQSQSQANLAQDNFQQYEPQQEQGYDVQPNQPQQFYPTNIAPLMDKSHMANYFETTQIKIYSDEIALLKASLEGKVELIDDEGKRTYIYPKQIYVAIKGKDTKMVPIREELFDRRTMEPIFDEKNGRLKTFEVEIKKPMANASGQQWILGFCAQRLGAGTALSNYSIDTALSRTEHDGYCLAQAVYLNVDEWGVDPTLMKSLVFTCLDRIEAARRRAVDNEERKGTTQGQTVQTMITSMPRSGGLPSIGNFGQKNRM